MKLDKIQNRSQKNSQSCVPLNGEGQLHKYDILVRPLLKEPNIIRKKFDVFLFYLRKDATDAKSPQDEDLSGCIRNETKVCWPNF
jgi:hypothetical protein